MRYRFYCRNQNAETHEEMKAANRNCNRTLAQAKKDHWMSFCRFRVDRQTGPVCSVEED